MNAHRQLDHLSGFVVRSISWGELYHPPQPLGTSFSAHELQGYFNDLTSKAMRDGPADSHGVPIARGFHGQFFYHPTMICQKALGYYDRVLRTGDTRDRDAFLNLSRWLVRAQDPHGGWSCFAVKAPLTSGHLPVGAPVEWFRARSPYSGMTQGQGISVLVRAHALTGLEGALPAAQAAFRLLSLGIDKGGVASWDGDNVSIEEVPASPLNTILNGWIFGMFGAWDLWMCTKADGPLRLFEANKRSLLRRLQAFDLGWWSLYDSSGNIAKPFYHSLHVAQLTALRMLTQGSTLDEIIGRWSRVYSRVSTSKARLAYIVQRSLSLAGDRTLRLRGTGKVSP